MAAAAPGRRPKLRHGLHAGEGGRLLQDRRRDRRERRGPTWTDDATSRSTANLAGKCSNWTLAGGYRFQGLGHLQPQRYANGLPFILFARHTLKVNDTDSIFIQFAGEYTPTSTGFPGEGNWVISGGSGAYAGIQGAGTWIADGGTFPYFIHTEYGSIHLTAKSG